MLAPQPIESEDKQDDVRRRWLTGAYFAAALLAVEGFIWLSATLRADAHIPVQRGRMPIKDVRVEPNQIDAFITANMKRTGVPGVSLAVVGATGAVYTAGYGTSSSKKPIASTTSMPIASLSKSMTAAAVLKLIAAERLSLTDSVRRLLPDVAWADPRIPSITVAQLLNQSSGIACHDRAVRQANEAQSLRAALDRLRSARLSDAPGAKWQYCNANYHLLAAIIERLTGESFAEHMSHALFEPLGMSSTTHLTHMHDTIPNVELGHALAYGFALPHRNAPDLGLAASGVVSSAEDLARWLAFQLSVGASADAGLSGAAVRSMHSPSAPESNYGFGWRREELSGEPYIFHSGRAVAYSSHQAVLPASGYAYAIVWNALHPLGAEQRSFINGLNAIMLGEAPTLGRPVGRIVDSTLAAFTLLWLAIGVSGALNAKQWVKRAWIRPYLHAIAPLVAYAIIALAIFSMPLWTPRSYPQDVSLPLLFEIWPAVAVLLAATALASLSIVTLRGLHVRLAVRRDRLGISR